MSMPPPPSDPYGQGPYAPPGQSSPGPPPPPPTFAPPPPPASASAPQSAASNFVNPYAPQGETRWTADTAAARLTIPYLGPEPAPSRILGTILQVLAAAMALLCLVRVGAFLALAGAVESLVDDPFSNPAAADRMTNLINGLVPFWWMLLLAVIGVEIAWRMKRRPSAVRNEYGEAYVEFPITWIIPTAFRVGWGVLIGAAFITGSVGNAGSLVPLDELPGRYRTSAVSNLLWLVVWLMVVASVFVANRSHEQRVARSLEYRQHPASVPFFPPLAGKGAFEISRGERSQSSGIGWVLRTSGLASAFLFGIGFTIGGFVEAGSGNAAGFVWGVAGAAMLAGVVWAMVRRYQQGKL